MRNCSLFVSVGLLFFVTATAFAGKQDINNKEEVRVETKSINPGVIYQFSRTVGAGRLMKAQDGKAGQVKRTYKIIFEGDKPVGKELIKEERSEPKDTIFLMGRGGYPSSRGSFVRSRVLTMVATAYTDSPSENGGYTITAMGNSIRHGVVAVDPRVIPLGTKLFVEGYGFAYACDTGGAIKGNRIDLVMPSFSASNRWGRRTVKVHVLSGR